MDELQRLLARTKARRTKVFVQAMLQFYEAHTENIQLLAAALTERKRRSELKKMR